MGQRIIHRLSVANMKKKMGEFFSMPDELVNLSIEETFGLVTAEALVCGSPAVVINAPVNPELIGPGSGYVVEKNDVKGILLYTNKIHQRGKASFSEQCIKYTRENFLKNGRIGDYTDV